MAKKPLPPIPYPTKDELETHAEALREDLDQFIASVRVDVPEVTDERVIFESWALQKISNLQQLYLHLVQRVDALAASRS